MARPACNQQIGLPIILFLKSALWHYRISLYRRFIKIE